MKSLLLLLVLGGIILSVSGCANSANRRDLYRPNTPTGPYTARLHAMYENGHPNWSPK